MTRMCTRVVTLLVFSAGISGLQAQSSSDSGLRRTSWGSPDLQGVWHFNTNVPLESPRNAGEIAAAERRPEPDWRLPDFPPEGDVGA